MNQSFYQPDSNFSELLVTELELYSTFMFKIKCHMFSIVKSEGKALAILYNITCLCKIPQMSNISNCFTTLKPALHLLESFPCFFPAGHHIPFTAFPNFWVYICQSLSHFGILCSLLQFLPLCSFLFPTPCPYY